MKKVLYLALAVVATAFATSCVKELADGNQENTGNKPEIEITGQVFEAKMEATKSVIDGKTPTWVEGDAISVFGSNETTGIECTFAGEGKFQVNGDKVVEGPFFAIYPHKEGHSVDQSTGIFTATVPAEQLIKAGENTAAGALVAVAASETPEFYFRNAVGLVRLENKREDIVSIKIESTNVEQMLAGSFTMDLNPDKDAENEAPAVTPATEGGSASVTLKSAEENGVLASGVYYAAILPGKIDGIKVTFTRKNGEKTETETVTKQQTTDIERNGGANLGAFFSYEIKNAQELLAWNKACAKWTDWDVVTLTDNIDCKDVINSENWTPNVFTGTFDGNEKTIDNFVIELAGPAAFFARMSGNSIVKNLKFGSGCSFTTTAASDGTILTKGRVFAASLVCDATITTRFNNIKNYGKVSATATDGSQGSYIGGICAYNNSKQTLENCKNYGEINYSAVPYANKWISVAGIFGHVTDQATIIGAENHGNILFTGEKKNGSTVNLAGISGGANTAIFNSCKNLGSIENKATTSDGGRTNIGGIIALDNSGIVGGFVNCVNGDKDDRTKGSLKNSAPSTAEVFIGGCVGYIVGYNTNISNFTNYGPISLSKTAICKTTALGGVVGCVRQTTGNSITKCKNYGKLSKESYDSVDMLLYMGGIVGYAESANLTIGDDTADGVVNYGAIESDSKPKNIFLGGIIGGIYAATTETIASVTNTIKNCKNDKDATISHNKWTNANGGGMGGVLGCHSADKKITAVINIESCINNATVKKIGQGIQGDFHVAGIAGSFYTPTNVTGNIISCKNYGAVSVDNGNYSHSKWSYVGGIIGHFSCNGKVESCENHGNVTCTRLSTSDGTKRMGGIVGNADNKTYTNCKNYGTIKEASTSNAVDIGGIIGRSNIENTTVSGCYNYGDIICENTSTTTTYTSNNKTSNYWITMGGIVGRVNKSGFVLTNCHCEKDCVLKNTNTATKEIMGGTIGYGSVKSTVTNCSSKPTVTNSNTEATRSGVFGGAWVSGFTITSCSAGGKYGETTLTAENYTTYCFGSDFSSLATTGITFAE